MSVKGPNPAPSPPPVNSTFMGHGLTLHWQKGPIYGHGDTLHWQKGPHIWAWWHFAQAKRAPYWEGKIGLRRGAGRESPPKERGEVLAMGLL